MNYFEQEFRKIVGRCEYIRNQKLFCQQYLTQFARTEPLGYFDESVWRFTIDKVTIFHDGKMIFQFVDGTEVEG